MSSRKSYMDRTAVLCRQCGETFPEDCGTRVPYPYNPDQPHMQGVRRLLCSPECAALWHQAEKTLIAEQLEDTDE